MTRFHSDEGNVLVMQGRLNLLTLKGYKKRLRTIVPKMTIWVVLLSCELGKTSLQHSGAEVSAVVSAVDRAVHSAADSRQEVRRFDSQPEAGSCTCLRGFSPGSRVSSHNLKTCM